MSNAGTSLLLYDGVWDIAVAVAPYFVPDFTFTDDLALLVLQNLAQNKPITLASIASRLIGSTTKRWGMAILTVKALLAAGHILRHNGGLVLTEGGYAQAYRLQVAQGARALIVPPVFVPQAPLSYFEPGPFAF